MRRLKKQHGFTIVELLIVIVVIAILATVTVVSFNGVSVRATNASRVSEFTAWRKAFELYKVEKGTYPVMPTGGYCLGTGFPNGKCRDYTRDLSIVTSPMYVYGESSSTALMNEIKSVTSLPNAKHDAVNNTVGPYITYGDNGYLEMTLVMKGKASDCPANSEYTWDDNAGLLLCRFTALVR